METLQLKGQECDGIALLQRRLPYQPGTAFAGRYFNRYRYGGIVFIADVESEFAVAYDDCVLDSVQLSRGEREITREGKLIKVPTLSVEGVGTFTRTEKRAIHNAKISATASMAPADVVALFSGVTA